MSLNLLLIHSDFYILFFQKDPMQSSVKAVPVAEAVKIPTPVVSQPAVSQVTTPVINAAPTAPITAPATLPPAIQTPHMPSSMPPRGPMPGMVPGMMHGMPRPMGMMGMMGQPPTMPMMPRPMMHGNPLMTGHPPMMYMPPQVKLSLFPSSCVDTIVIDNNAPSFP
jgi:hypothetical protein